MTSSAGSWAARGPLIVIAAALGLLFLGVMEVFRLRFTRGDVYPPYSSLRADPLGTQVLAAGLQAAGIEVSRHLRRLDRGTLTTEATWYLAALSPEDFATTTDREWQALLDVAEQGGRVVLAFASEDPGSLAAAIRKARREQRARERDASPDRGDADDTGDPTVALGENIGRRLPVRLGMNVAAAEIASPGATVAQRDAAADPALPTELAWHSAVVFTFDDPAWQVLYTIADEPVALERTWGRGSIVVTGDSYPLSNEAMLRDRATPWLAWLQGVQRRAVFDESHLGVAEQQGVMSLARRYGLMHTLVVLLAVGLLFVWRNNASLIPATAVARDNAPDAAIAEAAGPESAAGFVNLLRRTIDGRGLFDTSVTEFRRSAAWRGLTPEARQALEDLAVRQPPKPDALTATREAHALLARRGRS